MPIHRCIPNLSIDSPYPNPYPTRWRDAKQKATRKKSIAELDSWTVSFIHFHCKIHHALDRSTASVRTISFFPSLSLNWFPCQLPWNLQHRFPLERVGRRVFPPARGGFENIRDSCIMFDQLPIFVPAQLDLNWKWLHVGLMMQLLAVDRLPLSDSQRLRRLR
jgi:hypothetical protein